MDINLIKSTFPDWKKYLRKKLFILDVSGITTAPVSGDSYQMNGSIYSINSVEITDGTGSIKIEKISGDLNLDANGSISKLTGSGDASISYSTFAERTTDDESLITVCIEDAKNEINQSVNISDYDSEELPDFVKTWLKNLTIYNIVTYDEYFSTLKAGMAIYDKAQDTKEILKQYSSGEKSFGKSQDSEKSNGIGIYLSSTKSIYDEGV